MNIIGSKRFQEMEDERQVVIIDQILDERSAQDVKWGEQNHSPVEWISILVEEVGEASKEAIENHHNPNTTNLDKYRDEMIQVAAVALAMIECLDRDNWR
jgi:NTP pyrophosphatase (non-canonical NTP hydrolase)